MTASAKVHAVETSVGRLFVETHGEGDAILFWGSLFADSGIWQPQVEALSNRYKLILVDGPGHGKSGPSTCLPTLDACAVAMKEVLDAFKIERAVLVGVAWGAMLALRVALRSPECVRALGLMNVSARGPSLFKRLDGYLVSFMISNFGRAAFFRKQLTKNLTAGSPSEPPPRALEALLDRVQSWNMDALKTAVATTMLDSQSIEENLGSIAAPAWVLVGEGDRVFPPTRTETVAAAIPGARLERLTGAGHLLPVEKPRETTEFIERMLASLDGERLAASHS